MMWWFPCAVGILQNGFVGSARSFSLRKCDPSTMRILTDLLFLLFFGHFYGNITVNSLGCFAPCASAVSARGRTSAAPRRSGTEHNFHKRFEWRGKIITLFLNGSLLSFNLQHVKDKIKFKIKKKRQTARCFDAAHFLILQLHMKKQICLGCKIKLSHKYAGLNTCQHMF